MREKMRQELGEEEYRRRITEERYKYARTASEKVRRKQRRWSAAKRKQRAAMSTYRKERPTWTEYRCPHCGAQSVSFFKKQAKGYCSRNCKNNATQQRRRALKAGAYVSDASRAAILERDNWTCQLCHEPIDPHTKAPHDWSPALDHIIPLAQGGPHHEDNLQAAHFWCNSVKGAGEYTLAGVPQ